MKNILIVGGGLAGLTSGIYLQEKGFNVTIYEKNHNAGGFLTGWTRKNQFIDGCIHWMIGTHEDSGIGKIWRHIGGIDENTKIYHPECFYQIKYDDETFTLYNDVDKLEEELKRFSCGDEERIAELINALRIIGMFEVSSKVPYELNDRKEMMQQLRIVAKVRRFTTLSLEQYASEWNSDVIRYALTHGLVNRKFNVFYFLTTLSNLCLKNADIPYGGSKEIADRIVNKFISLGGHIEYNSPVDEIIIDNSIATGIVVKGNFISADYVIAACDVHHTAKLLKLDLNPYNDFDSRKEEFPTYSFVMAVYRVKKDVSNTQVSTIIKTKPYKLVDEELDYVSIRQFGYDDSMINDGYTTVEVFIETFEKTYEYFKKLNKSEYNDLKKKIGLYYLDYLKEYYKCDDIELLDVSTPLTYERYMNAYKGSFMTYALAPKAPQNMRSALVDGIDNVVIANQWIMMPGGTCVTLTMGKFAAQLIMNKEGMDYKE